MVAVALLAWSDGVHRSLCSGGGDRLLFPHNEFEYFAFGLRLGVANVLENGLSLGLRKTVGKISQPINSYTRFPEYHFMAETILAKVAPCGACGTKVLDVGSPKCFGLYLAYRFPLELHLTDISHTNVDEYVQMWKPLRSKARGEVNFALADARYLGYADQSFDVVYSMSVVEHVEGQEGDARSIREMIRVLKPNGLLVVSVPYGSCYVEQCIPEFVEAGTRPCNENLQFFQRIYDKRELERRILSSAAGLNNITITTVCRGLRPLAVVWGGRRDATRGILGWLNPVLSCLINRSGQGIDGCPPSSYGQIHAGRDIYGDVIISGKKQVCVRRQSAALI
jgi:ubiquinone/menaquinone biosynthesis C-methylase UbiE